MRLNGCFRQARLKGRFFMICTGQQYLDSLRDTREVYIDGERVKDVTRHPMMKPIIDIRARIYPRRQRSSARRCIATLPSPSYSVT